MISERANYDIKCLDAFVSNPGNYIYILEVCEDEERENKGYFTDAQIAKGYGMVKKTSFQIGKYPILKEEGMQGNSIDVGKKNYNGSAVAEYSYDCNGNITNYWSSELPDDVHSLKEECFENRFIHIPNPFQRGDVVRQIGKQEYGIVETSQSEWEEFLEQIRVNDLGVDWFDSSITVSFLLEDGKFSHMHINPIFLEKAEPEDLDPQKELLAMASGILRGESSLDYFLSVYDEYKQKL